MRDRVPWFLLLFSKKLMKNIIINTDNTGRMYMELKILGVVLVSLGTGMLIVRFLPWWGFIAAAMLVAVGAVLIIKKC